MNIMDINWDLIKQKCPKGFKKLLLYFSLPDFAIEKINFEICYCDLEKFFEENEIIIQITKIKSNPSSLLNSKNHFYVLYDFLILSNNVLYSGKLLNIKVLTNDEAKERAIYKSFEIMEGLS
jgi:hypothetical protein